LDPRSYGVEEELEAVPKGTLVRVAITNLAEPPTYCMGVVIEESIKNNQTLFPSVVVYNLETKKITREFLGTLKVISKIEQRNKI